MEEFVAANDSEKKAVFSQLEEEVGKLEGPSSWYFIGMSLYRCHVYFLNNFPRLFLGSNWLHVNLS